MGFGDDIPPALRASAFAATLDSVNRFEILILTFVAWDVIKLSWSIRGDERGTIEFDSGKTSTDFTFKPVKSGAIYSFSAQGCAKALDGSTNFCSPTSRTIEALAATNTNSLRQFLQMSGVDLAHMVLFRPLVTPAGSEVSLRMLMQI